MQDSDLNRLLWIIAECQLLFLLLDHSLNSSIHFRRPLSVQSLRAFSNLSSSVRIVAVSVCG